MMTSSIVVHILCVLCMARIVPGQTYTSECDEETLKTRFGFKEHPTDCSKYIQCLLNINGQVVGLVRDCGYGTYWNPTLLTCILATDTVCKLDLCYQQPDGKRRKGHGNCRGFYECQGSTSKPRCCPLGQYFHDSLVCVNNTADYTCEHVCFDSIPNKIAERTFNKPYGSPSETVLIGGRVISSNNQQSTVDRLEKSNVNSDTDGLKVKPIVSSANEDKVQTTTAQTVCDKSAIPEYPGMYKQTLFGRVWTLERPCSIGTIFVEAVCSCL